MRGVGGDAVSAFGCALDASVADHILQRLGDGCGAGRGALADLALGERRISRGENVDDALFGGLRPWHGRVGHRLAQPQGGPLPVTGELELDPVEPERDEALDDNVPDAVFAEAATRGLVVMTRYTG